MMFRQDTKKDSRETAAGAGGTFGSGTAPGRMGSPRSGASLFLLELIITISFFAVAAVVCIHMFVTAHQISVRAAEKTEAVRIAQNAAESFLAADGEEEMFLELLEICFPGAVTKAGTEDMSEAGQPVSEGLEGVGEQRYQLQPESNGAVYPTDVSIRQSDGLKELTVRVCGPSGNELYTLVTAEYLDESPAAGKGGT